MHVLDEIATWSESLPDWQSDAVRRLLTQKELSSKDECEVLGMLAATHGLADLATSAPSPQRLDRSAIPAPSALKQNVALKSIRDAKNVNALVPGQVVRFVPVGLTVIYGDNASGKSGYTRILKRACRARHRGDAVLPNVWGGAAPSGPAEATFDVVVDGKDVSPSPHWKDDAPSPDVLSGIAVFDADCARVYLNDRNEVVYVPYGMEVFDKLGSLFGRLQRALKGEKRQVPPLPQLLLALSGDTQVKKLIDAVSHTTPIADVDALATLSPKEQGRLTELRRLLEALAREEPAKVAEGKRRRARRLAALSEKVTTLEEALNQPAVETLKASVEETRTARADADLAAKAVAGTHPLEGIGSDVWKTMFEAARRYSNEIAYRQQTFPVVEDGARCILCQQVLDTEARERMVAFEQFVKDETEQQATAKEAALRDTIDNVRKLLKDATDLHADSLGELRETSESAHGDLVAFVAKAKERGKAALMAVEGGDWGPLPQLAASPQTALQEIVSGLEREAREFEESATPQEKARLELELSELEARAALASNRTSVLNHIACLARNATIDSCLGDLNTGAISRENRRLLGAVVTQPLRKALAREMTALGVGDAKVKLSRQVSSGCPTHYLSLEGAVVDCDDISCVLSEGEQRAIAIASCLAELEASGHTSGVVFDDPVCSFDHRWREKAARQLVKVAKKRQVIVFTHDVVFMLALLMEAGDEQVPLLPQTLRRGGDGTGVCEDDSVPWPIKSVLPRLGLLGASLAKLRKEYKKGETDEYRSGVVVFCERLRETLERAVEELLLNGVVQRFGSGVKVSNIEGVVVEDDDYRAIKRINRRCSNWLHDMAAARQSPPPTPDDLAKEHEALARYADKLKKRRRDIRKRRAKSMKPPRPPTP